MNKKKQIEVEVRGPLSIKGLKDISEILKKSGKFLGQKKEEVFFFQENKRINLAKDCLRIRKNEEEEKVCLKFNKIDSASQEIEFLLKLGECANAIKFFNSIGFVDYTISPSIREDYHYFDTIISLKWACVIGPHFEIEKIVNKPEDIEEAQKRLLYIIEQLGLKIWTEEEYVKHKHISWQKYKHDNI